MNRVRLMSMLSLLAWMCCASSVKAQSTAFTYQGLLNDAGQPAGGLHDFRFRIFGAASNGTQLGTTLCIDNLQVTAGTFTATLDFGNQFITPNQRFIEAEVRRDTGLNCSNAAGFVVLSPRQLIAAAPVATHAKSAFSLDSANGGVANAVFVDNAGNVGVGTTTPAFKFHVRGGPLAVENTGDQADLLWLASERSWVFRQQDVGAGTALKLESIGGGGNKNFIVQTTGNVGIGTAAPTAKLEVNGNIVASDLQANNVNSSVVSGLSARFRSNSVNGVINATQIATNGIAVFGLTEGSFLSNVTGVRGQTSASDANSFGVFSSGRLGSSGTKSFRIDHPENPTNQYLFHYCAESPEVINFYRGTATLDAQGRAVVTLPSYFARINTSPSYQLTPVGAAMPMLHVGVRISDETLAAGAVLEPAVPTPTCWFSIEGGAPGGQVCWRVEAVRNDEFVRRAGAPVAVAKPPEERNQIGSAAPAAGR